MPHDSGWTAVNAENRTVVDERLDFSGNPAMVFKNLRGSTLTLERSVMQKEEFSFFHRLRIRYAEIDAQGVVFNAHYLTWFDTSITEYFRETGFSYKEVFTERDLDFHLIKATLEYLRPVHFDQVVDIGVRVGKVGNSSVSFILGVFAAGEPECCCRGEIIWVCSKIGTYKSHPLPEDARERWGQATQGE
jgi:acyl-CoA thioester hydrolase